MRKIQVPCPESPRYFSKKNTECTTIHTETIYDTRDMNKEFNRGKKEAYSQVLAGLNAEIRRVSEPMLVDEEYLDGLYAAIDIVKGLAK